VRDIEAVPPQRVAQPVEVPPGGSQVRVHTGDRAVHEARRRGAVVQQAQHVGRGQRRRAGDVDQAGAAVDAVQVLRRAVQPILRQQRPDRRGNARVV
jgi:hypothetical protein